MPQIMSDLLKQYIVEVQKIYGQHLKQIILYGSYARGDFSEDSDIDIMVLVDLTDPESDRFSDALSELGFEYNIKHDVWVMPVVKNIDHFNRWRTVYPFYENVVKEGVSIYEAA